VFCPMAFDFKGALWLQRAAEIDNPFFGAAMLRCGEVRESFPPRPAPAAGGPGGHGHE
jgi:Cu(I)/Ag(I) efflux system membrane fusion protein